MDELQALAEAMTSRRALGVNLQEFPYRRVANLNKQTGVSRTAVLCRFFSKRQMTVSFDLPTSARFSLRLIAGRRTLRGFNFLFALCVENFELPGINRRRKK